MSFLSVAPESVLAAAGNLNCIGDALSEATAAAAAPTTLLAAPAADDVSVAIAAVLGKHAEDYQVVGARAAAFHARFVGALKNGVSQYLNTDVANAGQNLLGTTSSPAQGLLGEVSSGAGSGGTTVGGTLGGTVGGTVGGTTVGGTVGGTTVGGTVGGTTVGGTVSGGVGTTVGGTTGTGGETTTGGGLGGTTPPVTTPPVVTPPVTPPPVTPPPVTAPTAVSLPLLNTSTPLGQLSLTLNGLVDPATGALSFTGGSLTAPSALALAVDAAGAPYNAVLALGHSSAAFSSALQSGNVLGAVTALAHAPHDVVHSFLYGQSTITQAIAAPTGTGISSVAVNLPANGLLAPLQSMTVTMTPTTGSPSVVSLSGTQFGGLLTALQGAGAVPAQALSVPALLGDAVNLPILNLDTPLGAVQLSLSGTLDATSQQLVLSGGSLSLPPPVALAIDALGAPYNALTTLGSSNAAFTQAVQSGNLLGAVNAFAHAPHDVVHSFLYGDTSISQTIPAPPGSGYDLITVHLPARGLLAPLEAMSVIVSPTVGAPTSFELSGTEFGGLLAALKGADLLASL
jgi:hypothetical protein